MQTFIQRGWLAIAAAACLCSAESRITCAAIPVYGSPGYTPGSGGYIVNLGIVDGINYSVEVNNAGVATGMATRYDAAGLDRDSRALRWSATTADVLGDLGTSGGLAFTAAHAINNAGVAAGAATIGFSDDRAVRWDGPGVAAVQLQTPLGLTSARIQDINDSGVSLGMASNMGTRAVRWDAAGVPTVLPGLAGNFSYEAYAINNAGISIGRAFDGVTDRAVRWDASGAITELGHLGLDASGVTVVSPSALNATGTAVGYAFKHDLAGNYLGTIAVRWEGAGTAATELDTLAPNFNGLRFGLARDINDAGVTVGNVSKAPSFPTDEFGQRAARWDASGTALTVLATLGSAPNGEGSSDAWAINASGLIVGTASRYNATTSMADQRAVYWKPGASAPVDLNSLIDPASGWFLAGAYAVSDTGWVVGDGLFDPDGPGGAEAYGRHFLMQVPEPASTLFAACASLLVFGRRGARRTRFGANRRAPSHLRGRRHEWSQSPSILAVPSPNAEEEFMYAQRTAIIFAVSAGLVLMACGAGRATAHPFQVDQVSEGPPSSGFGISPGDAFGQEFTPTASALDVVEFAGGPHDPNSIGLRVNIRAGALDGPLLGTSQLAVVLGAPPMPVFHFDFESPVPLVPGNLYVLQPTLEPGSATVGLPFLEPGLYAGGRAIIHGTVRSDIDFVFRTGLAVPEPTAAGLLMGGLASQLAATRWTRTRRSLAPDAHGPSH